MYNTIHTSNTLPLETCIYILTNDSWLEIYKHSPGDVFAGAGLTEEGVEGIVTASDGLVAGHLAIRLDTVLQAVQLPAGVTNLDTGLADVD